MKVSELLDMVLGFDMNDEVEGYAIRVCTSEQTARDQKYLPAAGTWAFEIAEDISAISAKSKVLIYGGIWPNKPAVMGNSCSHCGTLVKDQELCKVCGQDQTNPTNGA